jgi:hypothetical protein
MGLRPGARSPGGGTLLTEWTYFRAVIVTSLAIPDVETPGMRGAPAKESLMRVTRGGGS